MKVGIFNEFTGLEQNYVNACRELGVKYEIVDIISTDWIRNVKESDCDGFLVRPSYAKHEWKLLYDERIYFVNKVLNRPVYPSYEDIILHENKKFIAYWLKIHNIPHADTWIFYNRNEAFEFLNNHAGFPLIFKPNVGSYSAGIRFLYNKHQAKRITSRLFTSLGFFNKGYTKWEKSKKGFYLPAMDDRQFNYIMFQKVIDVKVEWRMIRIGNSYFGHQKLKKGKFHSGSGMTGWVDPPVKLLKITKDICDIGEFRSMNLDIFEDNKGKYYINEMQPLFASRNNSQMYINGRPGRYIFVNGKWVFEEGYFNRNASCNLRVMDFVKQLGGDVEKAV